MAKAAPIATRRSFEATTARFLVTGASAAALLFGLSFALIRAGVPPSAATVLASITTVAASYTVQQAWTFRGRNRHIGALPRYLAVQVGCAAFSAGLAHLLARLGLPPLAIAVAATLASSVLSYAGSVSWVFPA